MKTALKFYVLCLAGSLLMNPASAELQPYNMPVGVTNLSLEVFDLHMLIFWICVAIGIVVYGIMLYSFVMHRKSRGHTASNFHENTLVEIIWTVVPLVILVAVAVPASKTLIKMENTENADLTIKITGYQWLWQYTYLDENIEFYSKLKTPLEEVYNLKEKNPNYLLEVDNELVLPVGKKVRFLITSNDVLHAWWVPDLAVKKDAIPGYINESWAKIEKPGVYRGQCAELCGRHHGFMPIVVRALPEDEYAAWIAKNKLTQKKPVANKLAKINSQQIIE